MRRLTVVALVLALCAACTSHVPQRNGTPPHRPGAAEPALAPRPTAAPAGLVRAVGDDPEGIVYDPRTKLVAVAVRNPSRLLLLDPVTLRVRRSVALPGVVRHLQLAGPGGPVLVPCESANALVTVPLDGSPVATIAVGKSPHDATNTDAGYVVGDEFGPALSVVSGGTEVRRITGNGIEQPGGVVGDGPDVVLVDVHAFTVSTFDVATGRRRAVAAAGSGPTHGVLTRADRLAVTDTRGNRLLTYSLDPLKQTGSVRVTGAPYGIAYDPVADYVWVTRTAVNQVVGYDLTATPPREVARYDTAWQPDTVAVAPGSRTLWVTGTRSGQVQRIPR